MELICARRDTCSFRAPENYFKVKQRFMPGICPVDNGPILVVEDGTDQRLNAFKVQTDPLQAQYREVVPA